MIDWFEVAANGVWISGLAIILGVFGSLRADVLARGGQTREVFSMKAWASGLNGGLALFSAGMAGLGAGWRMAVWIALALWFVFELLRERLIR